MTARTAGLGEVGRSQPWSIVSWRAPLIDCLLILIFGLCFAQPGFASEFNPSLHWTEVVSFFGTILVITFALTVAIESVVVCVILWVRRGLWLRVCGIVVLAKLITLPLAQIAWWTLNFLIPFSPLGSGAVLTIAILEVLVAVAEFFLLRWLLSRMVRRGLLAQPVSNRRLVVATVAANAASFVFALFGIAANLWIFI